MSPGCTVYVDVRISEEGASAVVAGLLVSAALAAGRAVLAE
jgi:hypothetical protein